MANRCRGILRAFGGTAPSYRTPDKRTGRSGGGDTGGQLRNRYCGNATKLRRGQNVVVPGEEFPSVVYAWRERCRAVGAQMRTVSRPEEHEDQGAAWNQRLLESIDAHTAAVSLSSAHWTDGTVFDLEAIGARAREVGAAFIVDGTQSVGALAFDFSSVRPDMLVCAGYKWLMGPYSLGVASIR